MNPRSGSLLVAHRAGPDPLRMKPARDPAEPMRPCFMLGGVDGFDDDEAQSECDEGSEGPVRFLATERNALEALELADEVFDAGAGAIERLREERRPSLGRCLDRDHRADAALAGGRAIGFGIIAFVPHGRPRRDVGSEVEQDLELRAVAGLTLCEVKREGASIQISLEVDLGREPAARAAQRVTLLPPFGACGRDVSPHDGRVEHLNQVGRLAHRREGVEEGLEHPGLAQAPEALPHGIPVPALGRQGAPRDVVDGEVMHRFEEDPVVPALVAPPRAAGPEDLQHRRPILLCHPRQHGRLLPNRPAKCHKSTYVRIHSPHTQPNPSTRPKEMQAKRAHLISFLKPGAKADSLPKEIWNGARPEKWRRLHPNLPSYTILAQMHRDLSEWVHPWLERWITVREAARLQSFHDGFIFKSSEWQMLKQIGNAVPPLLGRGAAMVVKRALEVLDGAWDAPEAFAPSQREVTRLAA